jgi:hypothetical protein
MVSAPVVADICMMISLATVDAGTVKGLHYGIVSPPAKRVTTVTLVLLCFASPIASGAMERVSVPRSLHPVLSQKKMLTFLADSTF